MDRLSSTLTPEIWVKISTGYKLTYYNICNSCGSGSFWCVLDIRKTFFRSYNSSWGIHCNTHTHIYIQMLFSLHIIPFGQSFPINGRARKNGWTKRNLQEWTDNLQQNNKLKQTNKCFPKRNQRTTFCSPFAMEQG